MHLELETAGTKDKVNILSNKFFQKPFGSRFFLRTITKNCILTSFWDVFGILLIV